MADRPGPHVFTDADLASTLDAASAVGWMRDAIRAHRGGQLVAPPRVQTELGAGRLVFTTGALTGEWYGYRSYDTFATEPGAQLVVVHDWTTGLVRALAVGNELGPRRVGAIGGVAADALARPDAHTLGLVGAGTQAWAQLWAIAAVRALSDITVFSRDPDHRTTFVDRVRQELRLPATVAATADDAVQDREIVVLATSSTTPVVDSAAIADGAYVTTVGPKQRGRAEFGPELAERAHTIVTDSIAQVRAYDPPFVLTGSPYVDRFVELGGAIDNPRIPVGEITLFCSVGLAGTEAYLLDRLVRSLA